MKWANRLRKHICVYVVVVGKGERERARGRDERTGETVKLDGGYKTVCVREHGTQ